MNLISPLPIICILTTLLRQAASVNITVAASFAATTDSSSCPSQCFCSWKTKHVQCKDSGQELNSFIKQVPMWTVSLAVVCVRSAEGSSALWSPRPDAFRHLLDAREISLNKCPFAELPDELFGYLPLLETVILNALNFATLPPNLFRSSPSLKSLFLIQIPTYATQSSRPLSGTSVTELRLTGIGLNGAGLLNLIAPVATRLRELHYNSGAGVNQLTLPRGAFKNTSSLNELNLSNNRLANFDFLDGVSASRLTLSYNPIDSPGKLSFTNQAPNWKPSVLEMNHAGLREFPLGLATAFPALQEVLLANNAIEELPPEPLYKLKHLTRLDLSSNRIRRLSSELKVPLINLLYRDRFGGHVYLANNPVHCNCELAWIFDNPVLHNNLPKNVDCASGGSLHNVPLIQVQLHQLMCLPASKPNIDVRIAVPKLTSASSFEPDFQPAVNALGPDADSLLQHQLPAGSTVQLTCTSAGDPAPTLSWLWRGDLLKVAKPPNCPSALAGARQSRQANRLVLYVDQARMLSQQMRLTCSATSAGTVGQVNSTVTLISQVPVSGLTTAEPLEPPPKPGQHLQKDKENDNPANYCNRLIGLDTSNLLPWQLLIIIANSLLLNM